MDNETEYDNWVTDRQAIKPSVDLTDRVMSAIETGSTQRTGVQLSDRLNTSLPVQWGVCLASLLVGSLPFLYVAYAAKLVSL